MLDLYVYHINLGGQTMAALSFLTPDEVQAQGLPTEAVLGEVNPHRPDMTVEDFVPNAAFLEFLGHIIQTHAAALPSLQKQAARVRNGSVYVVDWRRVHQGGQPPFEDVIGWLAVRQGELIPQSYNPNPSYQIISAHGPMELEPLLEEKLLEAARRLEPAPRPQADS